MNLNEINNLISILEKNEHFKKMLDPNDTELESIYEIATKYDESYFQSVNNVDGIGKEKVSCDNIQDLEKIVMDFYVSLDIPNDFLEKVKNNIEIIPTLDRAKHSNGKIYLGKNDGTFDYLKTVIHEVAHCIRFYSQKEIVDTGLIAEVESKEVEDIFYKYLINNNIKIIKNSNNGFRSLTQDDVKKQKLHEIEHDKIYIRRALEEYQLINVLRENMNEHGSYQFTEETLNKVIQMYGPEKINSIRFLRDNYLSSDSSFDYKDGYDVGNGRHLANEFRFIYARLITEYLDNTPYQDNFREYLLSSDIKTTDDMMTYFKINNLDELVSNQINRYNMMNQIKITPELETIFENIKVDSQFSSSQLMKKYAGLPEYQSLISRIISQTKSMEEQVRQIRERNPQLSDEMFFKTILFNQSKSIIETIKKDYAGILTPEIIERFDKFSVSVINAPDEHGDMTAHSDTSEVSINMAHFATDTPNLESKIVRAMGTMPHELFHFVFKMLKNRDSVDEKMVYELSNGEQATVKGMVGHMLNEGFVEKLSSDFCQKNNIYYSPNPTYIQFTKLCEHIMNNNPNINEQFLIHNNYEGVLEKFTPEARDKYKETERTEYIGNFKLNISNGEKRTVSNQEIVSSHNEKIIPKKQMETEQPKQVEIQTIQTEISTTAQETKKSFDQRNESEIQIANQIKQKNMAIKQQKEQQRKLEKPKVKTLTKPTTGSSPSSGFVDTLILTLITGFVAGAIFMIVYSILK